MLSIYYTLYRIAIQYIQSTITYDNFLSTIIRYFVSGGAERAVEAAEQ